MKRAIIAGLNYTGSPYQLSGCEADADKIAARMPEAIARVICKGAYSAQRFFADCSNLRTRCAETDATYFFFSGHGTRLDDITEADGRQGGLCFWDGKRIEVIPEHDFRRAVGQIPGSVFVYLDSCFSGEMSRRAVLPELTAKVVPFDDRQMTIQLFASFPVLRETPKAKKITWVMACADSEVAYDTANGGRFTKAFCGGYDLLELPPSIKNLVAYAAGKCQPWQTPGYKCEGGARGSKFLF